MRNQFTISDLPTELIREILLKIPITGFNLRSIGLASKHVLAPFVYTNISLSRDHILYSFAASTMTDFCTFTETVKEKGSWTILPLNYQAAFYGQVLAEPSTGQGWTLSEVKVENMWSRQGAPSMTKMVQRLFRDTEDFDPAVSSNRILRWSINWRALELTYLLLDDPRVDPSDIENTAVILAVSRGLTDLFKRLLKDKRVDPSDRQNLALRLACESDRTEMVKLLLEDPRVDPSPVYNNNYNMFVSMNPNYPLSAAVKYRNIEIVELLLNHPRVNPMDHNGFYTDYYFQEFPDPTLPSDWPLLTAIHLGFHEITRLFLESPRVDPSFLDNVALRLAVYKRNFQVVELLLRDPRVDPSTHDNYALKTAVDYNSLGIALMLANDSRIVLDKSLAQRLAARVSRSNPSPSAAASKLCKALLAYN
ncbi:ankyrin repeat-containing domain protein [Obelidium mucronatum]|nr:ankyrin repeat-containing domain protein [Obelidium mucronatum]